MMKCSDGTEARVGARVSLSHDTDSGEVRQVIDSVGQAATWNLQEPGLMIDSVATGMTYYPAHSLDRDEIRFISRQVAS